MEITQTLFFVKKPNLFLSFFLPCPDQFFPISWMMALAAALLKIGEATCPIVFNRPELKLFSGELGGLRLGSLDEPNSLS